MPDALPRRERPAASASPPVAGASANDDHLDARAGAGDGDPTEPFPAAHMTRPGGAVPADDSTATENTAGVEPANHMARPGAREPLTEAAPRPGAARSSSDPAGGDPADNANPAGGPELAGHMARRGPSAEAASTDDRPARPDRADDPEPAAGSALRRQSASPRAPAGGGEAEHGEEPGRHGGGSGSNGVRANGVGAGAAGRPIHVTGERPAIRPYTYRRPRPDRQRVVGVALAVILILGVSLAIVSFTQGSTGSPTPSRDTSASTSVPLDGGSTSTPSTGPGSTVVPTTAGPPSSAPGGGFDAEGSTGDQAGAPEIGRFAATGQGLGTPCGAAQRRITLAWESTGATSAQLDGPGAPTASLPPTGQATACRDPGPPVTYTLTVSGPGGTTFRTTTV